MAFPTTGVVDDANRANEGPPMTGWVDFLNGLEVNGNQFAGDAAGDANISYFNTTTGDNNSEAWATIVTKPGNGSEVGVFLLNSSDNGYFVSLEQASGTDILRISIINGGIPTPIGADISLEFNAGDGIGIERTGTTINAYRRASGVWSLAGTRTSATYQTAWFPGARIDGTTGRLDNFGGGAIVVASGNPWYAYAQQ